MYKDQKDKSIFKNYVVTVQAERLNNKRKRFIAGESFLKGRRRETQSKADFI